MKTDPANGNSPSFDEITNDKTPFFHLQRQRGVSDNVSLIYINGKL